MADQNMFDENEVAPPPAAPKGSAKSKAKGKAKAKAVNKAEYGKGPNKKAPLGTCICPNCTFPKYPGSRFCAVGEHKRAYDNLQYQARHRKDVTEAQRQAFQEDMANDEIAGREVEKFALDNPPELKRKALLDFSRFERARGVKTATADDDGDLPMTEAAFMKHCSNVLGLTDEEAEDYWKELYADKKVVRDYLGYKGRERLWIPSAACMRRRTKEKYLDQRIVEGSENIKNPTMEQRDMLRRHLARQDTSFNDEHFDFGEPGELATPVKSKSSNPGQDLENITPEKPINVVRERTSLHRQLENAIRKQTAELKKQNLHCLAAKDMFDKHPPQLKSTDRGLLSFARLLQFRQECGVRILGLPTDIIQLVPDAAAADSEGQAGPSPATPGSVLSAFDATAIQGQCEDKTKMLFPEWIGSQRVQKLKFWPGEADALKTIADLQDMAERLLDIEDAKAFLDFKLEWQPVEKALLTVPKAMKQAGDDLMRHLKSRVAEDAREKKRFLAAHV